MHEGLAVGRGARRVSLNTPHNTTLEGTMSTTTAVVTADTLRPGDVVHRGNYSMRVAEIAQRTPGAKTTQWVGVYTQCAFDPERVGRRWPMTTRNATLLTISRLERPTMRSEIMEVLRDHEWLPDTLGCTCRNHGAVNAEQHREHVADELGTVVDYWTDDQD